MASSDPASELMDQVQAKLADGPSLTAMRTGVAVAVPDLGAEERWPGYVRAASGLGIRSLLAVPLPLPESDAAVLTLYCRNSGAFRPEERMRIEAFARHASKNVGLAVRLGQLQDARDNMSAAMNSRTVIDLATGAIMARKHCSQDAAFQVLLHASNTRNIKLRDVAATVVTSISGSPSARTHFDE
ncbi:MAG: antitermination regulator [Pseudarthrobacter sp.]|nr:antitermination regulator [Pseudarthrobacter sp.]